MRKLSKRCLALAAAALMLFAAAGCSTTGEQELVTIELNEVTHSVF